MGVPHSEEHVHYVIVVSGKSFSVASSAMAGERNQRKDYIIPAF
jgi:hypothetical protein